LRVLGGVDFRGVLILSFCVEFELFLALLCHFAWLCRFSCLVLAFAVFLLEMTFLSFSWLFGSSNYASCGLGFELQTLCFFINGIIKGETEKPSGQFLDLIVMSH
jgi:predicted membrane metal-binding protein